MIDTVREVGFKRPMPRLEYVDALKVYATLLVIVVHVVATPVVLYAKIPAADWMLANVADAFCRTCVPLFLMASGATLLTADKFKSLKQFYHKRLNRLLMPAVFWLVAYWLYSAYLFGKPLTWEAFSSNILTGSAFYHLPFLHILIGLYVAAPLLVRLVDPVDPRLISYFSALWFGLGLAWPLVASFTQTTIGMPVYVATGYVGYFVLGRALRDVALSEAQTGVALVAFSALWLFTAGMTTVASGRTGAFQYLWYDYLTPNVAGMSVLMFLVLASAPVRGFLAFRQKWAAALSRGAAYTFGIFLVHPMLLSILALYGVDWQIGPLWLGLLLNTAAVAGAALAAVWLLRAVPVVRSVV